jgi:hypothetical protein
MLNPSFPIVSGRYQMTREWAVTLPVQLNRRVEEGSLVLWRRGFTMWIVVWNNNRGESRSERLDWLRKETSPEAFDDDVIHDDRGVTRYSYRLEEQRDAGVVVHALYCFAIGANGHVQAAIYLDDEAEVDTAKRVGMSFEESVA